MWHDIGVAQAQGWKECDSVGKIGAIGGFRKKNKGTMQD
jgi:hypothetical protein